MTAIPGAQGDYLRSQARSHAGTFLSQVLTNWNLEVFVANVHSSLWLSATQEDIERAFFSYRQLGNMLSLGPITGDVAIVSTLEGGESIVGVYSARASFQNGDAVVTLVSVKSASSWQCADLYVRASPPLDQSGRFAPDVLAYMRDAMRSMAKEERARIESELLSANELTVRHRVGEVRVLAELREEEGDLSRAAQLYQAALRGASSALDLQMKMAALQMSLGKTNDAIGYAMTVYRLAEDPTLFDQARNMLEAANARPAPPSPSTGNLTTNIEFVIVAIGDVSTHLLLEVRAELQNELEIPFHIWGGRGALPEPGRSQADLYVAATFSAVTQGLTQLQLVDLLNGIGMSNTGTQFSVDQKSDFLAAYMDLLGPQGIRFRDQYRETVSILATQYQYLASSITEQIRLQVRTGATDRIKGYVGVTDADLFGRDANFLFGLTDGEYGIVSCCRFRAINNYEPESRPRLLKRLKKQVLSTTAFIMGIPRCSDPSCARAFPLSLSEHDAKSEHLCPICLAHLEAYKRSPNSWPSAVEHMNRCSALFAAADYPAAIAEARRALQLCPTSSLVRLGLARSLSADGEYAESLSIASDLLQSDPSNQTFALEVASIYTRKGRWQEANGIIGRVLEADPSNIEAHIQQARTAFTANDNTHCQQFAQEAITLCPTSSAAYALLAAARNNLGDYAAAIESATKALSINTNEALALSTMGLALGNLNRRTEAVPYLVRAVEFFPTDSGLWRNLGVGYAARHEMENAILALQQAVALNKTNASFASDLAYTYFLLKDTSNAVTWIEYAIQMDPSLGIAYYNRALIDHAMTNDLRAIESLDMARKAGYPGSPQFRALVEAAVLKTASP